MGSQRTERDERLHSVDHVVTVIQNKHKLTKEDAHQSRKSDVEKRRSSKRDKARNQRRAGFPGNKSSLAVAAAAGDAVAAPAGNVRAVDANGQAVHDSQLVEMIGEVALRHGKSYEEINQCLSSCTTPQVFFENFHFFLNNPANAWRDQEQEISFHGDDYAGGKTDKS